MATHASFGRARVARAGAKVADLIIGLRPLHGFGGNHAAFQSYRKVSTEAKNQSITVAKVNGVYAGTALAFATLGSSEASASPTVTHDALSTALALDGRAVALAGSPAQNSNAVVVTRVRSRPQATSAPLSARATTSTSSAPPPGPSRPPPALDGAAPAPGPDHRFDVVLARGRVLDPALEVR